MNKTEILRQMVAEGIVLLKNEGEMLPIKSKSKVAVFGRIQNNYYKSGTGSGGGVKIEKQPIIVESIKSETDLILDSEVLAAYENFTKISPFDDGKGVWAGEPWSQIEMPLEEGFVKAASERNDCALVFIGRTAGESHDNQNVEGSFLLSKTETDNLELISKHFKNVAVILNVGNLINISFLDKFNISALLYAFHGGEEGANALAEILVGKRYPSGKLTDTQAYDYTDYPSSDSHNDLKKVVYTEDIYVGYRYFETFKKDRVQFPFGFGLGYTSFDIESSAVKYGEKIKITCKVTNTGKNAGKETVQVYFKSPKGVNAPKRQLVAYKKSAELLKNESQTLEMSFNINDMAYYDDNGESGHKSAYVLADGDYEIFVGTSVRNAQKVFVYSLEQMKVVKVLSEALAPVLPFERLTVNGYEPVPLKTVDDKRRIKENLPKEAGFKGDAGIKLWDVKNGKNTMDEFIAQLKDSELATLCCGEHNSEKTVSGTIGAFGGQTGELLNFGIPVIGVVDGPSGISFKANKTATLLPNGTALASSFNDELVKAVYEVVSAELLNYEVDSLLGPGINIHRDVLCGRNFEYFSEDPYLTGKIGAAATKGIAKCGNFATIKHFFANNIEAERLTRDSVVSERALREIYLKPFEIVVKEGENVLIMTSYNQTNGYHNASNYDLTTTVLRNEWGFDNLVMTDWWANCNLENGEKGNVDLTEAMVRAQNDLYMVCSNAETKSRGIIRGIQNGYITRGELERCAKNILSVIMKTNTFKEFTQRGGVSKFRVTIADENMRTISETINPEFDKEYTVNLDKGRAVIEAVMDCTDKPLSQVLVSLKLAETENLLIVCRGNDIVVKRSASIEKAGNYTYSIGKQENIIAKVLRIKQ